MKIFYFSNDTAAKATSFIIPIEEKKYALSLHGNVSSSRLNITIAKWNWFWFSQKNKVSYSHEKLLMIISGKSDTVPIKHTITMAIRNLFVVYLSAFLLNIMPKMPKLTVNETTNKRLRKTPQWRNFLQFMGSSSLVRLKLKLILDVWFIF